MSSPEYFEIYDSSGNPLQEKHPRDKVHARGFWHRTVHVWLINSAGEILLQQRGSHKDSNPGLWDISAAGHIDPGETSLQAALRETREELGVEPPAEALKKLGTVRHESVLQDGAFVDREFQDIYIWHCPQKEVSEFDYDQDELDGLRFVPASELWDRIAAEDPELVTHPDEYVKLREYYGRICQD